MSSGKKQSGSNSDPDETRRRFQRARLSPEETSTACVLLFTVVAAIIAVVITGAPPIEWAPAYPQQQRVDRP